MKNVAKSVSSATTIFSKISTALFISSFGKSVFSINNSIILFLSKSLFIFVVSCGKNSKKSFFEINETHLLGAFFC